MAKAMSMDEVNGNVEKRKNPSKTIVSPITGETYPSLEAVAHIPSITDFKPYGGGSLILSGGTLSSRGLTPTAIQDKTTGAFYEPSYPGTATPSAAIQEPKKETAPVSTKTSGEGTGLPSLTEKTTGDGRKYYGGPQDVYAGRAGIEYLPGGIRPNVVTEMGRGIMDIRGNEQYGMPTFLNNQAPDEAPLSLTNADVPTASRSGFAQLTDQQTIKDVAARRTQADQEIPGILDRMDDLNLVRDASGRSEGARALRTIAGRQVARSNAEALRSKSITESARTGAEIDKLRAETGSERARTDYFKAQAEKLSRPVANGGMTLEKMLEYYKGNELGLAEGPLGLGSDPTYKLANDEQKAFLRSKRINEFFSQSMGNDPRIDEALAAGHSPQDIAAFFARR